MRRANARAVQAYSDGMRDGIELTFAKLARRAEESGPLSADHLRRMLAKYVAGPAKSEPPSSPCGHEQLA